MVTVRDRQVPSARAPVESHALPLVMDGQCRFLSIEGPKAAGFRDCLESLRGDFRAEDVQLLTRVAAVFLLETRNEELREKVGAEGVHAHYTIQLVGVGVFDSLASARDAGVVNEDVGITEL